MSVTYSTFLWPRSAKQVAYALRSKHSSPAAVVETTLQRLQRDRQRIESLLLGPLRGQRVLELGPERRLLRARALAVHNTVTALDHGGTPHRWSDYVTMAREEGLGRAVRALGSKALLIDQRYCHELRSAMSVKELPKPRVLRGDVCHLPRKECFDVVCSWSFFEHLADPEAALRAVLDHLAPGGVFLLSIHLYTSNTGHHDIRSQMKGRGQVPLWGHLRPSTQHLIAPSTHLNHYRLDKWRELFQRLIPDVSEYQDRLGESHLRKAMTAELRRELGAYSDEELFTVELVFTGRKPLATPSALSLREHHLLHGQRASCGGV